MSGSSDAQAVGSPPTTLVITPYHIHDPTTWTCPEPLLKILQNIVLRHSIPGTYYQSAFYRDLNQPSRVYHLQTSPSEPLCGWLEWFSYHKHAETSYATPTASPSSHNTPSPASHNHNSSSSGILPPTHPSPLRQISLKHDLALLSPHATPSSSDGTITLGLPTRRLVPNISFSVVPFNAPLILIGSRDVGPDSTAAAPAAARARFEEEIKDQLVLFRGYTGAFGVAAGWREKGYHCGGAEVQAQAQSSSSRTNADPGLEGECQRQHSSVVGFEEEQQEEGLGTAIGAGAASGAAEQFITVSGWDSVEEYVRFRKLVVSAVARRGRARTGTGTGTGTGGQRASALISSGNVLDVGRISQDIVGETFVWGKKIA